MTCLTCPICGGPNEILGMLGNVYHFRCRNCGAQSHRVADENTVAEVASTSTMKMAECDGFNCKAEIFIDIDCEDEAYCDPCREAIECADEGHCGHRDCQYHNVCCACSADGLNYEPCGEYDTTAERDLDRAIDAHNDARGK